MAPELRQQAEKLLHEGKPEDALKIYQDLLAENPNETDILENISMVSVRMGKYELALKYITHAIDQKPHAANYHNIKGNILLRIGKLKEAASEYEKAIKLNPDYSAAYNNLGIILYRQKKLNAAKIAYEKAIQLEKNYIDAHYNLGILLAQLGESEQAISELNTTIELMPKHAPAYGQLAEIYLQRENYDQAIQFFKKRLELQQSHVESWHRLGQALAQENDYDEAVKAFTTALCIQPNHPECHHHMANAYLKMGDSEKALNHYLQQINIAPNAECYYNVGVLLANQERNQEATQYFEEAAKLAPTYLPIYLNLGAIYLKLNQIPLAIKHYQTAKELKPDDPEIQHVLTAITQSGGSEAAPVEYLQHLFDQYATYYDQHLVKYLSYQVPQKLHLAIIDEINNANPQLTILDLGCGTGLCGEYFKSMAKKLIGIDVSENMIAIAKNKHIYDELKVAEIQKSLPHRKNVDLILAADVFTYIGNLSDIFKKVRKALAPQGLFAFSVEKTDVYPYILQPSIRYAHSKKYLHTLIKENNFHIAHFDNTILRTQGNKAVEGYLVVLKNVSLPTTLKND